MGRILAVDLVTKRVGLALTDELRMLACPYRTIPFRNQDRLVAELATIVEAQDVETLVIGLPIRTNGSEGPECERAREMAGLIAAHLDGNAIRSSRSDGASRSDDSDRSDDNRSYDTDRSYDTVPNIVLWDESYSSRRAEAVVREHGKKRKNTKHAIDGIAASFILRSYMERKRAN